MLRNDIIEQSHSQWSSPCILVPKPDSTYQFCTDFRRVNALTKSDSYPIPQVDDCIDQIGHSQYISKIDLLKGYWQVPLSDKVTRDLSICNTRWTLPVYYHALWDEKCPSYLCTSI